MIRRKINELEMMDVRVDQQYGFTIRMKEYFGTQLSLMYELNFSEFSTLLIGKESGNIYFDAYGHRVIPVKPYAS